MQRRGWPITKHYALKGAIWGGIGTGVMLLLGVVVIAAGLIWLAAEHSRHRPFNLTPYVPRITEFLAQRGVNLELGHLELYYDDAPVLRAEGIRVLGPEGDLAVYVEAAGVKLSKGRLLSFRVSPKVIEARNLTLRLVRTPSSTITIAGFALAERTSGNTPDAVSWLESLPASSLWGRMKHARVDGLTLLLRDQILQTDWVLEDGKLNLDRYEDSGERGTILAQLRRIYGGTNAAGFAPTPVLVALERAEDGNDVQLEARFGQLNPEIIGDYLPAQLRDAVKGQGTLSLGSVLSRGNVLGEPWLTLRLRQAEITMPAAAGYSAPLRFPQLEITAAYKPSPTDVLTLRNVALTSPRGNLIIVSGTVAQLSTAPKLNLGVFSPGGDLRALTELMPDNNPRIHKTYRWLNTRLSDVTYRNVLAHIGLDTAAFPGCGEACGSLQVSAEIHGGTVGFLEALPPAVLPSPTQGQAVATLNWEGQTLSVSAPRAQLAEQQIGALTVQLRNIFETSPTLLVVSGTLAGDAPRLMGHLQTLIASEAPKGATPKLPQVVSGTHFSNLNLLVPMARDVTPTFASSTIKVSAALRDVVLEGLAITDGAPLQARAVSVSVLPDKTLQVSADTANLMGGTLGIRYQQNIQPHQPARQQASISGTLAGAWLQQRFGTTHISATGGVFVRATARESSPRLWQFEGTLNAAGAGLSMQKANWRKEGGQPLGGSFTGTFAEETEALSLNKLLLKGSNAEISGTLMWPGGTLASGWNTARARFETLNLGATQASAQLADGTLTLRGQSLDLRGMDIFRDDPETDSALPAQLTIDAQLEKLLIGDGALQPAVLRLHKDGLAWQLREFSGTLANGGAVNIRENGSGGGRTLTVNVDDLGRLLATLELYDKLKGGKLFGTLAAPSKGVYRGELKLNDFELRNPPILMRILGLLSLEQIVAGTDGTKFARATLPVALENSVATLKNARLVGPSMSLRLDGAYTLPANHQEGALNFNGQVAPAVPFNRLVAKVPLLGTLLTGSQDGLVVADFTLRGPPADPTISVQPLSILTPGLIKDMFR